MGNAGVKYSLWNQSENRERENGSDRRGDNINYLVIGIKMI